MYIYSNYIDEDVPYYITKNKSNNLRSINSFKFETPHKILPVVFNTQVYETKVSASLSGIAWSQASGLTALSNASIQGTMALSKVSGQGTTILYNALGQSVLWPNRPVQIADWMSNQESDQVNIKLTKSSADEINWLYVLFIKSDEDYQSIIYEKGFSSIVIENNNKEDEISKIYDKLAELSADGNEKSYKEQFILLRQLQEEESQKMNKYFEENMPFKMYEFKKIVNKAKRFIKKHENSSAKN